MCCIEITGGVIKRGDGADTTGSIQPAALQGAGVLQRRFAGKWMNVFQAVPGIHFIAGESMFWGDSELSRRPD